MNRYFTKINENDQNISWELDKKTDDVLVRLLYPQYYSPSCIDVMGNLFAVFDKIEEDKFKVLFLSESYEGMLDYFNVNQFNSQDAYYWAREFGDRDAMIDRVTDSEYAYWWAKHIGNEDVMINRVTESKYVFHWALYIGNKDVMINRVTNSEYAYWWAKHIGNKEIMKERITDKFWMKEFEKLP